MLDYAITLIKHYTKDTYKKGATIAVHAPYGGGKTFFATKLEDKIKKIKLDDKEDKNITYTPIYIDMWQNDYKDPLLTILESLNLEKTTWSKIKKGLKVILPIVSVGLNVGTSGTIGLNTKYIANLLEGKDKNSINYIKEVLTAKAKQQKLVFLIDEIDRCNPDFAITMLERIKHFFNIDNIVFVLFINQMYVQNLEQKYLGHGVDTNSYMAKFIDKAIYLKNDLSKEALIKTLKFCNTVNKDVAGQLLILADYFNLSLRELIQIDNDIEVLFTMKEGLYYNKEGLIFAFLIYGLKRKEFDNFKEIVDEKNYKIIQSKIDLVKHARDTQYKNIFLEKVMNAEKTPDSNELRKSTFEIALSDDNDKLYYTKEDLSSVLDLLGFIEGMFYSEIIKIIINPDKIKQDHNEEYTHIINQYLRDLCL